MKKSAVRSIVLTSLVLAGTAPYLGYAEKEDDDAVAESALPAAVAATLKTAAPGATFENASVEDEDGAKEYEIELKSAAGGEIEVIILADGTLVEAEEQLAEKGLPASVAQTIKTVGPSGKAKEIVKKTMTLYAAEKTVGEVTYELTVDANGELVSFSSEHEVDEDGEAEEGAPVAEAQIPPAVMATVGMAAAGATFQKAVAEDEDGTKVYEVMVKSADGKSREVIVSADGQLIEIEEDLEAKDLPAAVAKTIKDVLPPGDAKELEKKSVVLYEIEKEAGETTYEISVDATGKVISLTAEDEDEDDEDDEDHEGNQEDGEKTEKGEKG